MSTVSASPSPSSPAALATSAPKPAASPVAPAALGSSSGRSNANPVNSNSNSSNSNRTSIKRWRVGAVLPEPIDPFGEELTALLNAHPAFQQKQPNKQECIAAAGGAHRHHGQRHRKELCFQYQPLLSYHNYQVLRRWISKQLQQQQTAKRNNNNNNILYNAWIVIISILQTLSRVVLLSKRPGLGNSLICFFQLSVTLLVLATAITVIALLFMAQLALSTITTLSLFLIDIQEWKNAICLVILCPEWIAKVTAAIHQTANWIDDHLLFGKRYAGREWSKDHFVFENNYYNNYYNRQQPPVGSWNTDTTLYHLPPPSVRHGKRLCLDRTFLKRQEWSDATLNHVVAIDFCYVMLREDTLRKQAAKRKRLAIAAATASSTATAVVDSAGLLVPPDTLHEPLVLEELVQLRLQQRSCSTATDTGGDAVYDHNREDQGAVVTLISTDLRRSVARRAESVVTSPDEAIEIKMDPQRKSTDLLSFDDSFQESERDGCFSPDAATFRSDMSDDASSDVASDLPWIDVGAKIGMRLLNSAHIQRAMTDTQDRILEMGNTLHSTTTQQDGTPRERPMAKPVHSIWNSPMNVGPASDPGYLEDFAVRSDASGCSVPRLPPSKGKPPLSPSCSTVSEQQQPQQQHNYSFPPWRRRGSPRRTRASSLSPASQAKASAGDLICSEPPTLQRLPPGSDFESVLNTTLPPALCEEMAPTTRSCEAIQYCRAPLKPGVKVAVPIFPRQPGNTHMEIGTVVCSERIFVGSTEETYFADPDTTNCLSVTVKLDRFFLRNGEFAELTFRVMDAWGPRFMPRHSKAPVGSCVATSYGIGVLVGWRVEDDCHVIRSLWCRRGDGSAHAYLNRSAIHSTVEAAVGFNVNTIYGWGDTVAYVGGGRTFEHGRFLVLMNEGRHKGQLHELDRSGILSCYGAQFIPVIEHIREAATYQIQVDNYNAVLRKRATEDDMSPTDQNIWKSSSECLEILWQSFLKAVEEDKDFDSGVNEFMTSIIEFLERLDHGPSNNNSSKESKVGETSCAEKETEAKATEISIPDVAQQPGFWFVNDFFGGVFQNVELRNEEKAEAREESVEVQATTMEKKAPKPSNFDRAFAVLRTLMKTVAIARASSTFYPQFRLALAISYDFLLFIRTVLKVQQRNLSVHSVEVWKRAWKEIVATFGPIKERLEKIGAGIAKRMEKQGKKAKIRLLKFVDTLVCDERLIVALEQGYWDQCIARLEVALVKAKIIEENNLVHYRKTARFILNHIQAGMARDGGAAARNNEKLAIAGRLIQALATPRRSILRLFRENAVLELFERILVRAYCREEVATRMLTIHAANFHSLRHLRMLKDFSVAGKIWIPLLDAADEEFAWVVSHMPQGSKDFVCPLSSLFSLCVAQFHKINAGDLSKDWMDFLLEDDAVRIIHEIDMKLILSLESFSQDVREMMVVLPYYPSIDDDILNLMDEVDVDQFLKEASDAMDDEDKFGHFMKEKASLALERFLDYLPKMSIPVEKRDLSDGWVLTCRGEDGADLKLSDLQIKKENLTCQILGGDAAFFPFFTDRESDTLSISGDNLVESYSEASECVEESVLDHIREMILQAQRYGCWRPGVGGVNQPPTDRYVATVLQGLPVSTILNCAIELWRNLEIDDDELLEIAVRDVSYQIQLQKEREDHGIVDRFSPIAGIEPTESNGPVELTRKNSTSSIYTKSSSISFENNRRRFNPRVDPTVFFLEMKNMNLHLENFLFRIEKNEKRTIFDPVFEGKGYVSLQNVSICVRIECAKERVRKPGTAVDFAAPILQVRQLDVRLEKVKLKVRDTGFGSDWLLNQAVTVFENNITKVVEDNLKDQINEQAKIALQNLNSYFVVNPNILLNILGISLDDLEESVVWV